MLFLMKEGLDFLSKQGKSTSFLDTSFEGY